MRKRIRVVGAVVILFFSVHTLGWAFTTAPQPQDEMVLLLAQAREMIQQGHFKEAVAVLQRLLPQVNEKKTQARIRLFLCQAYLSAGNTGACEESLRAVFENQLNSHVEPGEMGADLRLTYGKIKAEYWYDIGAVESVEERMESRVIARPAKKPKKKRLWPKLLAGALLAGLVVAMIVVVSGDAGEKDMVVSGDEGEQENVTVSGLLFKNATNFSAQIEISGVNLLVASRRYEFIPLDPGGYNLYVTALGVLYTYFVEIRDGERTTFEFKPAPE